MGNYPGFPPSYRVVKKFGGYHRTCFVLEVLSLESLSGVELSTIQERLEFYLEQIKLSKMNIESFNLINPNEFDPLVRAGLRV